MKEITLTISRMSSKRLSALAKAKQLTEEGYKVIINDIGSGMKMVYEPENECAVCSMLEQGDILYQYGEDDVGIMFNKIINVQFCPVCGKKLLSFQEKYKQQKELST